MMTPQLNLWRIVLNIKYETDYSCADIRSKGNVMDCINNKKMYLQIADYVTQKILNEELKLGEKVPSLNQLSDQFRVNRNVAEKALARLENQGWLTVAQGKGYFVSNKPTMIKGVLSQFNSISNSMMRVGVNTYIRLNNWRIAEPTVTEREALELSPGEKVYCIDTIRFIDEMPLSLSTTFISEKVVPGIERHLTNTKYNSLFDVMREHYGISVVQKYSLLEAQIPLSDDAKQLKLMENMPIMWKKTLWVLPSHTPISLHISRIRGDCFQCQINFQI